jgi:PEGA domain-containing protein
MNRIWCLILPFLCISCATITRGVHDKLYVQSEPSGAAVQLSTGERGVTPAKFIKSRKESFTLTVTKPGYIAQTVKVESKFSPTGGTAMAGNILGSVVVGVGVDAMSGATSSLYPNPVVVHLVPAPVARSSKKTTASSVHKMPAKKSTRPISQKTTPAAKPSPTPQELPPAKSSPPPESTPPPPAINSPTPYSPPPVLQSVPDKTPGPN